MIVKLDEVCERASSNIKQSDVIGKSGDYPIYGAAGYIGNVDFYHQENPYIAVVKDGAGIGRTMLLPAKSSVIGTMQYLIPKPSISAEYLKYVVQHMHLEKYYSGATIPHIYFRDYKEEQFNLSTPAEQAQIVGSLKKVEWIIEKRQQQLSALDDLIKARFVEMFGCGKYETVKASDVCDFITKGTTPPGDEIVEDYQEGLIPFLKVYNLSFSGELLFDTAPQYISREVHDGKLARSKVYPNDVLMNIVGPPLGKFSLVSDEFEEWNINQAIAIFRAKEQMLPRYLMAALMQPNVLRPFLEQAVGIRQLNLSLEQCRNLEFSLPPLEEQRAFVEFSLQIDKSKSVIQQSLDKTQLLFDSLMQEYFG